MIGGFSPLFKTSGLGIRLDFNKVRSRNFITRTSMKNTIDLNVSSYCMAITLFIPCYIHFSGFQSILNFHCNKHITYTY